MNDKPAALATDERIQGRRDLPGPLASTGEPSAPPARFVGEIRPLDVGRALRELLLVALLIAIVGLAACAWNPGPTPDPTPPPPPPWEPPEAEQCHLMTPPATAQCWHRPPPGPWLYICADGTNVGDPAECVAEPPPPPPPPPPECAKERDLVADTCSGPDFRAQIKAATTALGDLTGNDPNANLDALAAQLRKQMPGRCVISGVEAAFIRRDDGKYEENHAVFFGDGGWTGNGSGKFMGCHRDTSVSDTCGPPLPPPLHSFNGPKAHHRWYDSTAIVRGDTDPASPFYRYCSTWWTDNRLSCPPRPEGHPERDACIALIVGGERLWRSDGEIVPHPTNSAMAGCAECTWIEVCDASGSVCSRREIG